MDVANVISDNNRRISFPFMVFVFRSAFILVVKVMDYFAMHDGMLYSTLTPCYELCTT